MGLKTRSEIKTLFENIGYSYKVGKFNAIFNRGREYSNSQDENYCSVRGFMQAVQELHNVE